jgi:hypothetical protein
MKTVVIGMVCAFLAACGGTAATDGEEGPQEEAVGTSEAPLIWKPTGEPWYDCLVGLQICRCSGDVVDCRKPIVIFPTSKVSALDESRERVEAVAPAAQ